MRFFAQIVFSSFVCMTSFSCDHNKDTSVAYYRDFDLFYLKGIDSLKSVDTKTFVKVKYLKDFPVNIQYFFPERTVTLVLENSFELEDKQQIHVYSTSNLLGGQPGKHRVYSTHYEENKYLLYVSFSDTLLCENQNVPKDENYFFDLYLKESKNQIIRVSKGEGDSGGKNSSLTQSELYLKWRSLLITEYNRNPEKAARQYRIIPY